MATKAQMEQALEAAKLREEHLRQELLKVRTTASVAVNIKMPMALRDRAKDYAALNRTTLSAIVEEALTEWLNVHDVGAED